MQQCVKPCLAVVIMSTGSNCTSWLQPLSNTCSSYTWLQQPLNAQQTPTCTNNGDLSTPAAAAATDHPDQKRSKKELTGARHLAHHQVIQLDTNRAKSQGRLRRRAEQQRCSSCSSQLLLDWGGWGPVGFGRLWCRWGRR